MVQNIIAVVVSTAFCIQSNYTHHLRHVWFIIPTKATELLILSFSQRESKKEAFAVRLLLSFALGSWGVLLSLQGCTVENISIIYPKLFNKNKIEFSTVQLPVTLIDDDGFFFWLKAKKSCRNQNAQWNVFAKLVYFLSSKSLHCIFKIKKEVVLEVHKVRSTHKCFSRPWKCIKCVAKGATFLRGYFFTQ